MARGKRMLIGAAVLALLLPVRTQAAQWLVPVGRIVGLRLTEEGLTVAAFDEGGSAARDAGVKIGDRLVAVNGLPVADPEAVRRALTEGETALTLVRSGKTVRLRLVPGITAQGPRLGLYLRQGIAGIGTVTFYDPETGLFGALGHGVSDGRGRLLSMKTGSAFEAELLQVRRGRSGEPGQLRGSAGEVWGSLTKNTAQGVFGISRRGWPGQTMATAAYADIRTGAAVIRSTVSGAGVREYSVEILKIYPRDRADGRNFLIRVTDPALLEITGGIVQGMSGSPIIQDGKLVGAVTHVCVFR